jgi:hypothetical protein
MNYGVGEEPLGPLEQYERTHRSPMDVDHDEWSGRNSTINKGNGAKRQHIPGVDGVLGLENKRQQSATATHHYLESSHTTQQPCLTAGVCWKKLIYGGWCANLR